MANLAITTRKRSSTSMRRRSSAVRDGSLPKTCGAISSSEFARSSCWPLAAVGRQPFHPSRGLDASKGNDLVIRCWHFKGYLIENKHFIDHPRKHISVLITNRRCTECPITESRACRIYRSWIRLHRKKVKKLAPKAPTVDMALTRGIGALCFYIVNITTLDLTSRLGLDIMQLIRDT